MSFDTQQLRNAMGQFATGVVVIAANENGTLVGFAAQSFVSLSLEPPLVLFCPQKTSSSWPRIRALRQFCINVLPEGLRDTSESFAVAGETPDVGWNGDDQTTVARLTDSIATIDCEFADEHEAGDHTIVVARVMGFEVCRPDIGPLLYFRGEYGRFTNSG